MKSYRGTVINGTAAAVCGAIAVFFGYQAVTSGWPHAVGIPFAGYVGYRYARRALEWWARR